VALVSRSDTRHAAYVESLASAGIEAGSYVADVRDTKQLLSVLDAVAERYGRIDVVYYGRARSTRARGRRRSPRPTRRGCGMR